MIRRPPRSTHFPYTTLFRSWAKGPRSVGAYQSIAWFYAASTGQISIRDGYKGPSGVVVSEGAGGLDSIGWARRVARRGTPRSEEHTSELQSRQYLVCRLLLEKKK